MNDFWGRLKVSLIWPITCILMMGYTLSRDETGRDTEKSMSTVSKVQFGLGIISLLGGIIFAEFSHIEPKWIFFGSYLVGAVSIMVTSSIMYSRPKYTETWFWTTWDTGFYIIPMFALGAFFPSVIPAVARAILSW
jgi:hypothetical protein